MVGVRKLNGYSPPYSEIRLSKLPDCFRAYTVIMKAGAIHVIYVLFYQMHTKRIMRAVRVVFDSTSYTLMSTEAAGDGRWGESNTLLY